MEGSFLMCSISTGAELIEVIPGSTVPLFDRKACRMGRHACRLCDWVTEPANGLWRSIASSLKDRVRRRGRTAARALCSGALVGNSVSSAQPLLPVRPPL